MTITAQKHLLSHRNRQEFAGRFPQTHLNVAVQRGISIQPGLQAVATAAAVLQRDGLRTGGILLAVSRLRGCFRGTTPSLLLLRVLPLPRLSPQAPSISTVPRAPLCSDHNARASGPPQLPSFPRILPVPGPGSAGKDAFHTSSLAPNSEKQRRLDKEMEEVKRKAQ